MARTRPLPNPAALASLAVLFAVFPAGACAASLPAIGAPAPALNFTQLYQAPARARATWPGLRGKVVVLEFWATWCGPCIAAVPHLNQVARSLDPAKVQFISVDDEDPKVVKTFLAKRKMEGWAGVDTTGGVFKRYGVTARPTTIIVDAHGKIAGITDAEELTAQELKAVAAGRHADIDSSMAVLADSMKVKPSDASDSKPLFEISLSKLPPDNGPTRGSFSIRSSSDGIEMLGITADWLLTYAYHVEHDRLEISSPLPDDRFNLHTDFAGADDSVTAPILQAAIAAGLHLDVKRKTVTRSVYVLGATPAARDLVKESASTRGSMSSENAGKIELVNVPMASLASSLESWLEIPVIDNTGITTHFDSNLELSSKDLSAINQRLRVALGVELTKEDKPVEMLEVTPLPPSPSPADKPALTAGSN